MKKIFVNLLIMSSISFYCFSEDILVPTVIIDQESSESDKEVNPIDQFSIFKVERVSQDKIKSPVRLNLSDVVQDQVGVDSQTYCANCGAKRLRINGLKGEHTSILVDGLPLHSAVSSFYGMDNIPTNGLAEILVMRGAGASLTNPEAIGGTLNLVTINPLDVENSYSTSFGVDDEIEGKSQNHNLIYGLKSKNKKFGLTFGGQFNRVETWDVDENNVAEFPQRENFSLMAKSRFFNGSKNDFSVRLGLAHLEILGGPTNPVRPTQIRPIGGASESDFIDGSVENTFVGDPARITDWVDIERSEMAFKGTHYMSSNLTYDWNVGHARQKQQAIYQHGFDYSNIDNLFVFDNNFKATLGMNSIFTLGSFYKDQRLRSASEVLFEQFPDNDPRDIKKDSFDFTSHALYAQYSYFLPEKFELDIAVRADNVRINWLELVNEIDEVVVAPRVQMLHYINHHLTQRLSYGLGYRAPLTFFESQHGNFEGGYEVDITDLEKADSYVYSLSWNTPNYYLTGGLHYTYLRNMAFGFEEFGQPIRYRNTEESFDIFVADLLGGYKIKPWWLLEASIELFSYEDGYKIKLPTAAIEERYQVKSTINKGRWSHSLLLNMIGSRDLSKYGSYSEHYVNRNQASEPILDPTLELKDQRSPFFFTLDASISYKFSKSLNLSFNINNIFDYTQTGEGDSPSAWHWHFNHAHFDQLHTWGPNTGRQFFLSLNGNF